jgi:thiol-disulfide isomerase/thioredoxin
MNTLVLVLAFVAVAFLVYKLWKPVIQPPKSVVPANEARIYFFFTNWCGHSKKAMPEWAKLEKSLQSESYYGKTHVEAIQVDCEADKAKCTTYGINSYPTVMIETKEGIYDFNKRPTLESLKAFLRETLGKERASL